MTGSAGIVPEVVRRGLRRPVRGEVGMEMSGCVIE